MATWFTFVPFVISMSIFSHTVSSVVFHTHFRLRSCNCEKASEAIKSTSIKNEHLEPTEACVQSTGAEFASNLMAQNMVTQTNATKGKHEALKLKRKRCGCKLFTLKSILKFQVMRISSYRPPDGSSLLFSAGPLCSGVKAFLRYV